MVSYEENNSIAVVRLNRPAKRNALTPEMLADLTRIFTDVPTRRSELRAIILTGTGAAFCAGTDIAELVGLDEASARVVAARGQKACAAIEDCVVPVIAAVNGAAVGGGCELALACHLRVGSNGATFSLPEAHLGVIPAYGGTRRLASIVGRARALAAMLAGDALTAEEAFACGLINRIVGEADVVIEAVKLGETIADLAPLAVRACLRAVVEGSRLEHAQALALEAELFAGLFATEDVREGTTAFLEKRQPRFKGR